jgi:hypothetical protein
MPLMATVCGVLTARSSVFVCVVEFAECGNLTRENAEEVGCGGAESWRCSG